MDDERALVEKARSLLAGVTPLSSDCGRVCGHACCQPDENGKGGMLLFPGEAALYADDPDFEVLPDETVVPDGRLIVCKGTCRRENRPLACRFFPMRPTAGGKAVMDRRSAWVCPRYEGGRGALLPDFVAACDSAAHVLAASEVQRTFLTALRDRIRMETDETNWWR
ncbi:MAG: hypothetical protein IJ174_05630 [Clostridia bacterium]|nr:hypothetical protein [Clostridia bacterium]